MLSVIKKTCIALALVAVIAACDRDHSVEHAPLSPGPKAPPVMQGFSWIVEDELAAMPLPGRNSPLVEDVEFLRAEEIRTLVSLTEDSLDTKVLDDAPFRQVHIPVADFTAPTLQQMIEFVEVVSDAAGRGEPVGVHCTAGLGRSGTMSAAYLVANGASAEAAMARVRELRPGSIETEDQENAVRLAEAHFSAGR